MSPSRTNLEANQVASAAARMALRARQLKDELGGPSGAIRDIHTAEPWGHDEYGEEFRRNYLTGGDEGAGAEDLLGACDGICDTTDDLGVNAGVSAIESDLVDEERGRQLGVTADEIDDMVADVREGAAGQSAEPPAAGGGQQPVVVDDGAAPAGPAVIAPAGGAPTGGGGPTGTDRAVRSSVGPQLGSRFLGRPVVSERFPGHLMAPASHRVFESESGEHRLRTTTHRLEPIDGGDQAPAGADGQRVVKPAVSPPMFDAIRDAVHEARQEAYQDALDAYLADHPASVPDGPDLGGDPGDMHGSEPGGDPSESIGTDHPAPAAERPAPVDETATDQPAEPRGDPSGDLTRPATVTWRRDLIDPAAG